MKKQMAGMHEHRLKDNAQELVFATLWKMWNRDGLATLGHLLDVGRVQGAHPPTPADRDAVVAATVIQWLGSPVGQGFLEEAGYVRRETSGPKD